MAVTREPHAPGTMSPESCVTVVPARMPGSRPHAGKEPGGWGQGPGTWGAGAWGHLSENCHRPSWFSIK